MSKTIRPIICPNCGSTENTPLKENFYRCRRCGTDYFIDRDERQVNVNQLSGNESSKSIWHIIGLVTTIVSLAIGAVVIVLLVTGRSRHAAPPEDSGPQYEYFIHDSRAMECDGQPYLFCLALRRGPGQYKGEFVSMFYNIKKDAVERVTRIEVAAKHQDSEIRRFNDMRYYFTLNNKFIWRVDRDARQAEDITRHVCDLRAELSTGVASVEVQGNGMLVMNNAGDQYVYYPSLDQVYSLQENREQRQHISMLLASGLDLKGDTVCYTFEDIDQGDRPKLCKTTRDPAAGNLVKTTLVPDRRFFSPSVLYGKNGMLLVSVRTSAAPDAPVHLQRLDPGTGELIWSTPGITPESYSFHNTEFYYQTILVGDMFVIREDYRLYETIDTLGNFRVLQWDHGSIHTGAAQK